MKVEKSKQKKEKVTERYRQDVEEIQYNDKKKTFLIT